MDKKIRKIADFPALLQEVLEISACTDISSFRCIENFDRFLNHLRDNVKMTQQFFLIKI
jgi:hypothetical protein